VVPAFAQAGDYAFFAGVFVLFAVSVQWRFWVVLSSRQGFSIISISVPSLPSSPILLTLTGVEPERGPVAFFGGELASADPVAELVLEFVFRSHGLRRYIGRSLISADNEVSIAIEVCIFLYPVSIAAFRVAHYIPFRLIDFRAVELIAPCELPELALFGRRQKAFCQC